MKVVVALLAGLAFLGCQATDEEKCEDGDLEACKKECDDENGEACEKLAAAESAESPTFPNGAGMSWAGAGDRVETVELESGALYLRVKWTGDDPEDPDNFIVKINDQAGKMVDLVSNDVAVSYEAEALATIPEAGSYVLDVSGAGTWTIESFQPSVGETPTELVSTAGNALTQVFWVDGQPSLKASAAAVGEENFIVRLFNAETGEFEGLAVNDVGEFVSEEQVAIPGPGWFIFEMGAESGLEQRVTFEAL